MPVKIDRLLVAHWEVEALETFVETYDHVLSTALVFSVRTNRRPFKKTIPLYKQGPATLRKLESEPYTFEKLTDIVADWCGVRGQRDNKEELVLAWASDPATEGVVAAHRFAEAYRKAVESRPQMALPL
jgi:hypothetical protein